MGFSYNVNVLNQKGSPAIYTDTFANRPLPGYAGRLFVSSDTSAIYEDTGTAWTLIANVSSGAGTLQQVTTNGNTSNVGIVISAGGLSTNSLTDTALTSGSVLFSGAAGLVSQDNAAFFWDDTNNRLGINTITPGNPIDVHFAGTGSTIGLNNTSGNPATIVFANTGVNKWRIGNTAGNTFDIINVFTSTSAISVNIAGNVVTLIGALNGLSAVFSSTITSQTNGSTFGNSAIGGNPLIIKANAVSRAMQLLNTLGGAGEITITGSATTSNIGFNTVGQSDAFVVYNDGSNRSNGDVGMWGATARNLNFFDATNNNINAQIQYSEVNSNTGQLLFKTNNAGTSATRLTISNTGAATFTGAINGTTASLTGNIVARNGSSGQAFVTTNGSNADFVIETVSDGTTKLGTTGNKLAIASGSGNVLIGSTTDDTINKLQVTGKIKATSFNSNKGNSGILPNVTATTIFTLSTVGMYLVNAFLVAGAGDVNNYASFATILYDGVVSRIVANNGALLILSLSGNNVQVSQASGGAQSSGANWTFTIV